MPVAQSGSQMETIVSGVAGRYASSLFQLAQETKTVDAVAADLDRLSALIAESGDLRSLIESPRYSAKEQEKAMTSIASAMGMKSYAANFIRLVAAKRRLQTLPDMIRAYRDLVASSKGIVKADVRVAQAPSDKVAKDIEGMLRDLAKADVSANLTVDPSLIGGLVVKMGSRMVDASVRTKLNSIRLAMKEAN